MLTTYLIYQALSKDRPSYSSSYRSSYRPPPKATKQELTKLFRVLDENGDGFIDLQEFKIFETFPHRTGTSAREFKRADYNNDDKISLQEWLRFATECPARSSSIRSLIQCIPEKQCGFKENELESLARKELFHLTKKNGLNLDATSTNVELEEALITHLKNKRPEESWSDWIASFW